MNPTDLYWHLRLDTINYLSRERDMMRRKHAVRQVLYRKAYTYEEIAKMEDELYGKLTPTNHTTIMNSVNQPFDALTENYVKQCEDFLSYESKENGR